MMNIKKIFVSFMISAVVLTAVPITSMADSTGWRGSSSEGWRYYTSDTEYVKDSWKQIGGVWYYFYSDGKAVTDSWAFIDGKLYHFDKNGAMEKNKWIDCGEHDYKKTEYNTDYQGLRDWRYVGSDGAAYSGWRQVNGEWYCFVDETYIYAIGNYDYQQYGYMVYGMCTDAQITKLYSCDTNGRYRRNTWYQNSRGEWTYYHADGSMANGWEKINNKWYFFNTSMAKGVVTIGSGLRFDKDKTVWKFSSSGALDTNPGWYSDGVRWFYGKSDGSCYHDTWLQLSGKWYYFGFYGEMVYNKKGVFINGKKYDFDSNGVCTNYSNPTSVSGFCTVSANDKGYIALRSDEDITFYVGSDGVMYRNKWLNSNGSWYYFDKDGIMLHSDDQIIDGKSYSFDKYGKCSDHDGQTYKGWYQSKSGSWHYYGDDGKLYTGWRKINNKWYYFMQTSGIMTKCGLKILLETGKTTDIYYFGDDGDMKTGWIQAKHGWYYAGSDGLVYRNKWLNSNGKWYYFDTSGIMLSDKSDYVIGCRAYDFDSNGVCRNPSGKAIIL